MTPSEALAVWLRAHPGAQTVALTETRTDAAAANQVQRWTRQGAGEISWRLDASSIVRYPNGWIDITGVATRSGIFPYDQADGSTRRELRPDGEVFDPRSMASLVGVPFTNNHPAIALDSQNTQQHQVGTVLAVARRDNLIEARIRLTDENVIKDIGAGKVELSGGYSTEVLDEGGAANGETYDAIQTNIRYNHLALVDEARAGPVARLRLDRGDAVQKGPTMKTTIKIRNTEHKVDAATLAKVMKAVRFDAAALTNDALETESVTIGGADLILPVSMVEGMLAALTGGAPAAAPAAAVTEPAVTEPGAGDAGAVAAADADPDPDKMALGDRLNSALARLDAIDKKVDGMPTQVRQQITTRGRIERIASQVLPSNFRYDSASDAAVMAAAVAQVNPDLKTRCDEAVAKKQDEFLRGMFEVVVEKAVKDRADGNDVLANLVRNDGVAPTVDPKTGLTPPPSNVTRIDTARSAYYDRLHGRKPEPKAKPTGEEGAA